MNPLDVTEQAAFEREMELNRQAWEGMKDQLRREHAGKFVAIAFGRLITATRTCAEANAAIQQLQPSPRHVLVFPVEEEPLFDEILSRYTEYL